MPRTDNDTWDLATSVGATATMVAAARAIASKADNPLIDDRFAEPLVRAVGVELVARVTEVVVALEGGVVVGAFVTEDFAEGGEIRIVVGVIPASRSALGSMP